VCVCADTTWRVGVNDNVGVRKFMTEMVNQRTLLAVENEVGKCSCYEGIEEEVYIYAYTYRYTYIIIFIYIYI
jgi:hypothetical protein